MSFIITYLSPPAVILINLSESREEPFLNIILEDPPAFTCIASMESFDLILMDIQRPEMDGLEATRRIRALQLEEALHTSCVIVGLSAHAMSGDRERYMAEGMVDYLTKPIRTEALQEVLDTCRQQKAAGRQ